MRILALNNYYQPNLRERNTFSKPQSVNSSEDSALQSLNNNAVSFGFSNNQLSEFMKLGFSNDKPRLERLAITFMDALEVCANELKQHGVSFSREYCAKHAIKSPDSYISKIKRSGRMQVPDQIRATVFVKDLYDLSILTDRLLPALNARGFVVAKNPETISEAINRGYIPSEKDRKRGEVVLPDLVFRLKDIKHKVLDLAPEYRYCALEPQKSGYEDVQMRLIRSYEPRKNPMQFELLIIFGENYAKAKKLESEKIYEHVRLFDELNIKKKNYEESFAGRLIFDQIGSIKKMLTNEISTKLYDNARKKDSFDLSEDLEIKLTEKDLAVFENYFDVIKGNLFEVYQGAKNAIVNNPKAKRQLSIEHKKDQALVDKIRKELKTSIEFFNSGAYKEELEKPLT